MDDKELVARATVLSQARGKGLWNMYRKSVRKHLVSGNTRGMLEWSVITATMYVKPGRIVDTESNYLFSDESSRKRWGEVVVAPEFGGEFDYDNEHVVGKASSNLVHQAHYIKKWEECTGMEVGELDCIVEYGGGYGAMAYLCHKLGFSGTYIIYDFPIMLLLQEYYLSNVGIKNLLYTSEPFSRSTDLFISLWGMSEAPPTDREWVPKRIKAEHNLMVYISRWFDIENTEWFESNFMGERTSLPHIGEGLSLLMS